MLIVLTEIVMFPFKRAIRSALLDCGCIHWKCWNRWRTWLIVVTALIYSIVILIVVPLLTFALYAIKAEAQFSVCLVAAIFVLLTIPIFLANLLQHLVNYTCPNLQAYIIRTIWIVPIYSVDSVKNYLLPLLFLSHLLLFSRTILLSYLLFHPSLFPAHPSSLSSFSLSLLLTLPLLILLSNMLINVFLFPPVVWAHIPIHWYLLDYSERVL